MSELLCHLFGDYVLQNHWMATQKTRSLAVAIIHACVYMLPFALAFPLSLPAAAVMLGTHAVIDRWRLALYWMEFYGIGTESDAGVWLVSRVAPFGAGWGLAPKSRAPDYLFAWLAIIVDNTCHLTINHLALLFL